VPLVTALVFGIVVAHKHDSGKNKMNSGAPIPTGIGGVFPGCGSGVSAEQPHMALWPEVWCSTRNSKILRHQFSVASLWAGDLARQFVSAPHKLKSQGHSLRHIAATLGCGYGTVRTRLQRVS